MIYDQKTIDFFRESAERASKDYKELIRPAIKTAIFSICFQAEEMNKNAPPGNSLIEKATKFVFENFSLEKRSKNEDNWVIINNNLLMIWSRKEEWVYEKSPSEKTDHFKKQTYFSFEEAVKLVEEFNKNP